MSVRVYRGKHRDLSGPSKFLRLIPWLCTLALFIAGTLWLFISDDRKDSLFVFILIFALSTAVFHALVWHGFSWSLTFGVIAYGISFSFLALNSATGLIFGDVTYGYSLGNQLFSVPAILPIFWLTISYITFTIARRIYYSVAAVSILGGLFSTAAVFGLEQVAIAAGYWSWLNDVDQVKSYLSLPLKFYLATFVISVIILFMAGQLNRNEKLSSRPPFFNYLILTLVFFAILMFNFNSSTSAYWVLAAMGSTSLVYALGALRKN